MFGAGYCLHLSAEFPRQRRGMNAERVERGRENIFFPYRRVASKASVENRGFSK
jgi:hypothetical protein